MNLEEIKAKINTQYADTIGTESHERKWLCDLIESLRQQLSAAQAKIDELMLEYCPEEMTNEQIAEYEKHQRPAWRNFSLELKKEQK